MELRSRRQTVLADWLHYDIPDDEFWAKGNVTVRRGIDWITGPEAKFKRDDGTGFFVAPEFHVGREQFPGRCVDADFPGGGQVRNQGRALHDVRGRQQRLVPDVGGCRARQVALGRNRAQRDGVFQGRSDPLFAVPDLSAVERAQVRLPHAGLRVEQPARLRNRASVLSEPGAQLRRDAARATDDAGAASRWVGKVATCSPIPPGELDGEFLPHDRITGTNRWAVAWKHNQNFGNGLAGFINTQEVSDDTYFADLSDRLALTSQTNLPHDYGLTYNKGPVSLLGRWQSFQTLQDPNNPITPPYFREPQLTMAVKPVEWQGLDFAAAGEFVRFHQPALQPNGNRSHSVSDSVVVAAGQRVVFHRADRIAHDQLRSREPVDPAFEFQSRAADHHRRCRPDLRARHRMVRSIVHPDPRAAHVLRADPVSQSEHLPEFRYRHRRLQFLATCSTPTAISAATASAMRIN